jgi:putative ABC transport system ATP-binding protein
MSLQWTYPRFVLSEGPRSSVRPFPVPNPPRTFPSMETNTPLPERVPLRSTQRPVGSEDKSPLITLNGVSKTYTTGEVSFTALDNVDLTVNAGEFVAVVGPSGSGKSTLLNLIAAIDKPSDGDVVVDDVEVSDLNENDAARWRGRNLGVIFQFFQLLPTLSLADNVMLPMDFAKVHPRQKRPAVARALLDRVGLADHADKLPSQVSGGQQQRAAIARALSNDPPIIVGDEPTGNLDSASAASMMALFDTLVADGRTIVLVTHDRELAHRTGRSILVQDGVLTEQTGAGR